MDPLKIDPAERESRPGAGTAHGYCRLIGSACSRRATSTPSANAAALTTLGRRFAFLNGHWPEQAIGLYPTDGTTDDFAYGDLGVAAFTFELGNNFFEA